MVEEALTATLPQVLGIITDKWYANTGVENTQTALVTDGKLLMTAYCHHPVFLNCSLRDIRHKEKTNLSFLVDDRHGIL